MSILEPLGHGARSSITGVIVVVPGRRYLLEFSATDDRVFSLGSAIHADVRVIGPDVAPVAFFFERAEGGVQLVPGYSERVVRIDGRPLSGATMLGARHSLDVGGIAVILETIKRRREVPSESGVSFAPSDEGVKTLIDPRENARRLALRAREIVDDEAQTQLALPSGRAGLLGGYPGVSEQSARPRPRGIVSSDRTPDSRRTLNGGSGQDVEGGGADCGDEVSTQLFALVGRPPMSETVLENSELARVRQERAARIRIDTERGARLAVSGSCDAMAGRSDEGCARPHGFRGLALLLVRLPARWFTAQMIRRGKRAARRRAYIAVAALGLMVGAVLVVAFSVGRTATASSVQTTVAAAPGVAAARTPTDDLALLEPRELAVGRSPSSTQPPSTQPSSTQPLSPPGAATAGSAPLKPSSPMRNAEALEGGVVSSEVGARSTESVAAESRPDEAPFSELSVAALAYLEAGRYSEAAARYAEAAHAYPQSVPHRVIARLMQRASSQQCSGASAQGLAFCPEVQR